MLSNLNLYHIFYCVAKYGNISQASKELYISQPAISKSIKKLEDSLGAVLFIRSKKGVLLTSAGKALYEQVQLAFENLNAGENQVHTITALGIDSISIGVSSTLCKYFLLPYLKEFTNMYPHIKVSIACQSTYQTVADLEKGNLDIGIIADTETAKGLHFISLKTIHDTFVTTANYLTNLQKRVKSDRESELEQAMFLMLNEENVTRKYIDSYLSKRQISLPQKLEVSTMDLLIEFAKIDLGIACVIREFVDKELQDQSLIEYSLSSEEIPSRDIGMAIGINSVNKDAVMKLKNVFEEKKLLTK